LHNPIVLENIVEVQERIENDLSSNIEENVLDMDHVGHDLPNNIEQADQNTFAEVHSASTDAVNVDNNILEEENASVNDADNSEGNSSRLENQILDDIQEEQVQAQRRTRRYKRLTKKPLTFIKDCLLYYKENHEGYQEKENRYTVVNDKITISHNIFIDSLEWSYMQKRKPSLFLNDLALILWNEKDLSNRAFDLTRKVQNIPNRSPVKLIEKQKLRLLISLYNDFLKNKHMSVIKRMDHLLKVPYLIRHKIRNLRSEEKKKFKTGPNPNRRLRYDIIDSDD